MPSATTSSTPAVVQRHPAVSLQRARDAAAQATATKDVEVTGRALSVLGARLVDCGLLTEAAEVLERAEQLRRTLDDPLGVTVVLSQRGLAALQEGDLEFAAHIFAEVEKDAREINVPDAVGTAFLNLGLTAVLAGRPPEVVDHLSAALDIGSDSDDDLVAYVCVALAVHLVGEAPEHSVRLAAAATSALRQLGETLEPYEQGLLDVAVARARDELGDSAFVDAWSAAHDATFMEAGDLARTVLDRLAAAPPSS